MKYPFLYSFFFAFVIPLLTTAAAKAKPRHLAHYNDVRFICAAGKKIEARFILNAPAKVELKLSDGRKFVLPQDDAASGIRYANKDESVVFWSKGDEAFLAEGETITYADCVAR